MTPAAGRRVGPYELLAPLGAGGMGEVWRARDTKLGRDVALKLLPDAFAADGDRVARFRREAQVLASLNHPHIAAIHGLEETDGTVALVLELVEGDTLEQRLKRGPIPMDEAIAIARQIAEGLEAAHERGVIHRDLKPANVKVTRDGNVKLLDFGLAKALSGDGAPPSGPDLSNSPTLAHTGTQAGVILGTAAYMSPEQARGKSVDKRADIWAFGVVLFEILTGKRLFGGETVSDTLAAVLRQEIDWSALPPGVPSHLRRLLRRCLERDPRQRLHDIADARLELLETAPEVEPPAAAPVPTPPKRRRVGLVLGWTVAAVALFALAATRTRREEPKAPPGFHRLTFQRGTVHSARFAPDQQTILYGAAFDGRPIAVFSTRADAIESRPLDLPEGDIVGIARNGEMALLLGRRNVGSWVRVGTLARAPLAGGSPRSILEGVYDADISPDGQAFAVVVQGTPSGQQLEYPIGTVRFRNEGWIGLPRIAPDGKRVAFVDHPFWGDDRGYASILGADGKVVRLTGDVNHLQGIDWSPSGEEVWASYGDNVQGIAFHALAPGKKPRILMRSARAARLQDVAADGRVLFTDDDVRAEIEGRLAGDEKSRPYTWWSDDYVAGLARDGSFFAGHFSMLDTEGEYPAFVRRNDGKPPMTLGPGAVAGVTSDGHWVVCSLFSGDRTKLILYPTGTGVPRTIDLGEVEPRLAGGRRASSSADGRHLAFLGVAPGQGLRGYIVDIGGGPPKAVTPDGTTGVVLSPDASRIAAVDAAGRLRIHAVAGGEATEVPGFRTGELPLEWEPSGRSLLVWDQRLPAEIVSLDIGTGRREPRITIAPGDPAGVLYANLVLTPDARYYLLRVRRTLSALTVVEPLQ